MEFNGTLIENIILGFLILNLWLKSLQRIIQKECQIIPTGVSDRG